ncbi:hypothetical protein SPSPH_040470 [Sporomusa sphaeroides DSM 2875]|uniref:Uncharacterized protein n=1 Tax=Sporomusa sphaeroides DSM 2875 TaxID=1337886 RepID=A0ABM9WA05_9FIRM|nr:hypothetical protein SSPH_04581 [Sporomusa sphaeroides DSM 2875]
MAKRRCWYEWKVSCGFSAITKLRLRKLFSMVLKYLMLLMKKEAIRLKMLTLDVNSNISRP